MNIKCTEKQAVLIEIALETLSRLTSGQLSEIKRGIESFKGNWIDFLTEEQSLRYEYCLKELKSLLFPNLHANASYGVGMKEIGDAQIAYEMYKVLSNFRVRELTEDKCGVLSHKPLHYSSEPLIICEE